MMEYRYQLQYILFSIKFTTYIFSNRKGFFFFFFCVCVCVCVCVLSEGHYVCVYIYIYIFNTIKQINMINSILGACVHLKALRPLPKWPINV